MADTETELLLLHRAMQRELDQELLPKMKQSLFVLAFMTEKLDASVLLQLGAAVALGKPIILLAQPGLVIPAKLRRVMDEVVIANSVAEGQELLMAAITRIQERRAVQ